MCQVVGAILMMEKISKTTAAIANTNDQTLFQTQRTRTLLEYAFDVPNGNYDVLLYFAEIRDDESGLRVMDVSAEGGLILDDFDAFVEAGGANIAHVRSFNNITVLDGRLDLVFAKSHVDIDRRAAVAAIAVGPAGSLGLAKLAGRQQTKVSSPENYALEQNYPNPL